MSNKGLAFVISAPAGCGKNTLLQMLIDETLNVKESVSCTTRKIRPGEIDGVHYNFLTREEFEKKIEAGEFLEHAEYCGNYYGTLRAEVERHQSQGNHAVMVVEVQGAMQVKKNFDAIFIFICAPSPEELRKRLENRQTETKLTIDDRLSRMKEEMKFLANYDYKIVNDKLEDAYQVLKSIFIAEEHKIRG